MKSDQPPQVSPEVQAAIEDAFTSGRVAQLRDLAMSLATQVAQAEQSTDHWWKEVLATRELLEQVTRERAKYRQDWIDAVADAYKWEVETNRLRSSLTQLVEQAYREGHYDALNPPWLGGDSWEHSNSKRKLLQSSAQGAQP